MPTVLHESFYDDLKKSLTLAIEHLPYDPMTIRPQIHMNYPLQIEDETLTPDIVISLTATQGPTKKLIIPYVGETALTEQWDHVFKKVESMIATYPEAILASIVLVREAKRYASPEKESIAAATLHNSSGDGTKPKPLPLHAFIDQRSTPRDFDSPFKVADHTWCHVESVEYFIWIKGDDEKPIDMRNSKPENRAHGVRSLFLGILVDITRFLQILLPELHMDNITSILKRGMSKMRDIFLAFQKELDLESAIDHSALEKFVIPSFPVNWTIGALGVLTAVDLTSYLRYVNWHAVRFRDSKRARDSSYAPSDSECDSSGSEAADPKPKPATSTTIQIPSHLTFRSIILNRSKSDSIPMAGPSSGLAGPSRELAGPSSGLAGPTETGTHKSSKAKSKKSKAKSKARSGKGPNKRAKT